MKVMAFVSEWHRAAVLLFICSLSSACTGAGGSAPTAAVAPQGYAEAGLRVVKDLPAPTNTAGGSEQSIAPDDVLEVDVFQVDNLDRTAQVDSSGRISLPLIGAVTAQGKTVRQLEEEIESRYGAQYLQSPDVTIFVKESARQRVTVDGEVARAGLYPVSSNATLMDAIALAGGMRDIADAGKVYVYRDAGDGTKLVANYNVTQIRNGAAKNPRIYGGDVVIVFTSKSKVAMNNLKEALGIASSATRLAVLP
jgi:polysaccharide export outer membrane protein